MAQKMRLLTTQAAAVVNKTQHPSRNGPAPSMDGLCLAGFEDQFHGFLCMWHVREPYMYQGSLLLSRSLLCWPPCPGCSSLYDELAA